MRTLKTALVALYLLLALVGLLALAAVMPLWFAPVALVATVCNGFMASDIIGRIWRLDGQYDEDQEEVESCD